MTTRRLFHFVTAAAVVILIGAAGCQRDINTLEPVSYPIDAEVFTDQFGPGVQYQSFGDSKLDALQIDFVEKYSGSKSMKITVPNNGYAYSTYPYAGGALVSTSGRNLSGYNAITLWAKASVEAKIILGIGNDNTGTSQYTAQQTNVAVHTNWTKYILPIPSSARLTQEKGLFFYSAANLNGVGYTLWFDDIQFESIGTIVNPRTSITTSTVSNLIEGDTLVTDNTVAVTFSINGTDQTVQASSSYLTYTSSADSVATVNSRGVVRAAGAGNAFITAKLGSVPAAGKVTLTNVKAAAGPTVSAPTPTVSSDKVISLFSDAYANVPVDTWAADWPSRAKVTDRMIGSDNVKKYTTLDYAGILFSKHPVDVSAMTHLHMDIWTQYPTTAATFKVKLVDFGDNGVYGGGDDAESEIAFIAPTLKTGSWMSLDIPLFDFSALTSSGHLGQLVISGDLKTLWMDNVYFYQGVAPTGPKFPIAAAPAPTASGSNVISLFSDAYTNVTVDKLAADWGTAKEVYKSVAGCSTMLYSSLGYTAIEFAGANLIDISAMENFHMDIWTPNAISGASFTITLVDFGANGVYDATGGDDKSSALVYNASSTPALTTGSWVSLDIPLSRFTGLTTKAHLAQLVIAASGSLKTVWMQNVYFYKVAPGSPAPTPPVRAAADVISLFSDVYSNVAVDKWRADWSVPSTIAVTDKAISGDNIKLYSGLGGTGYTAIEFTSQPIDAAAMNYFHMDIWTPNSTATAAFKIKLVDFGPNGVFGGGDDASQELAFNAASTPPLATGSWVSLDIPFSRFSGLTTRAHLAQLVISGDLQTVWVDNIYFHK